MSKADGSIDRRKFLTKSAALIAGGGVPEHSSFLRKDSGRQRSYFVVPHRQREPGQEIWPGSFLN